MSDVELTVTPGLRLHFHLYVGYDGTCIPRTLRNKDKRTLQRARVESIGKLIFSGEEFKYVDMVSYCIRRKDSDDL